MSRYQGMSDELFSFYEVTGWYKKDGTRGKGKRQYASEIDLIRCCGLLPDKIKVKLFSDIATEKWVRIMDSVKRHMNPSDFATVCKRHLEYGPEMMGGLAAELPRMDPRDAAKANDIRLPHWNNRSNLTPEAALSILRGDHDPR